MKNTFVKIAVLTLLILVLASVIAPLAAQCPMCKMSAEANLKNGGTFGRGLNTGILYLFFTPYILVGSFAYWWWRNRKKDQAAELEEGDL